MREGFLLQDQRFKADGGKSQPTLLEKDMVHALAAIQATLDYGAQKYEARSWQGVAGHRYDDAARRHRIAYDRGELRDSESGLLHPAHQIICELFQLEMYIREELKKDPTYDYTTYNKPPQAHKSQKYPIIVGHATTGPAKIDWSERMFD